MTVLLVVVAAASALLVGWRLGYGAGHGDGNDGVHAPWPWSTVRETRPFDPR